VNKSSELTCNHVGVRSPFHSLATRTRKAVLRYESGGDLLGQMIRLSSKGASGQQPGLQI
jgi:hypothetical protein